MSRASVLAAALVITSFDGSPARTETPPAVNVVVITLDTTRADRLSPYGFLNVSLPHLERLAASGVVFDQALSVAPLTLPAHASLFTGLLPPRHNVRDNLDAPLAGMHDTLAELLQTRGFRTGAFVGSVVLESTRGLAQGFDTYRGVEAVSGDRLPRRQRRADAVVDDALRWMRAVDGSPYFLWVHLYDPHLPYDPPEPYASIYGHNPYVGEIAHADSQIGRLLATLDGLQMLERTVVIVAGDHGESLGDHGEPGHGVFVYESVLRVPLIIRAPGIAPRRVGGIVRLTDVMPTALDLVGIPAPVSDGVSLVGAMTGTMKNLDLEAYAESEYPTRFGRRPLRALRDRRFKLIDALCPELYDLERDPFERHNLYGARRATADAMTRRLRTLVGRAAPQARYDSGARPVHVPADLAEQLGALGYLGRQAPPAAIAPVPLPDPRHCNELGHRRGMR